MMGNEWGWSRGGGSLQGEGRGVIEGRWRINLQHSSNISYIKTDCFPFLGFGKKEREREREKLKINYVSQKQKRSLVFLNRHV